MYPRNAASPEKISIGAVVQISDGAVQTSGCTVRIITSDDAEGDGAGTTGYSTDGIVLYTPTQGETNHASFVLIAKKTGCIPATVTVVTTESAVPGRVSLGSILGTALTETAGGYLTAGLKKLLDVATPVFTLASVNQTGDSYALANGDHGFVSIQDDIDTLLTRIVGTLLAGNHNAQSGDSYGIVNNGTYGNSALKTLIDALTSNLNLIAPTTDSADSATLTTGTAISGTTYAKTQTDDNDPYILAPVNPGGLDLTLVFNIGLGRAPVSVAINGYWNGNGRHCDVKVYDYVLGVWDTLTNSSTWMGHRTSDANYTFPLNREHIDPDTGDVSIRFVSTSTTTADRLRLDRVVVGTIDSSTGASPSITAQDVWTYITRTLTSDSGEPIDSTALAAAILAAMNATPPDVNTKTMTDIAFTATQLATLAGITAPSKEDVAGEVLDEMNATPPLVTVDDYSSGKDPASLVLVTPAQKIETDVSGHVTANVTGAITVTGDVTLAALQPNYPPAKAGDAMALTVGERTTLATAIWASATRTLTSFGSLVSDIATAVWGAAARTLTAFGFTVPATVADKTGYALTSAYDPAKTAAQASALATVDGIVDAIKLKTDNLPSDPADESLLEAAISAIPAAPTPPTTAQIADKILGRNLAGGSDGGRTVQDALRFNRNKVIVDLIGHTITVYEEDDTTIAWQGTLTTTAAGQHISSMDPA